MFNHYVHLLKKSKGQEKNSSILISLSWIKKSIKKYLTKIESDFYVSFLLNFYTRQALVFTGNFYNSGVLKDHDTWRKKVMKKGLLLTLALISLGSLAACGKKTQDEKAEATASEKITVVSREDGSGTRGAFIELFGIEEKGSDGSKKDLTTKEAVNANKTDVMLNNIKGIMG